MRPVTCLVLAVGLAAAATPAFAANDSAHAQLSWSATSLVSDLGAPGSSVSLAIQLSSGVTSFKGAECEIRWTPVGDSASCLVRSGTLFRTSTGTTCTYLNRGTPVSLDLLDKPGRYRVSWTNSQSLTTCTGGTIAQITFDLSGCPSPPASFALCAVSLTDANGAVTTLPSSALGTPVTLAGGAGFVASCANPPVVDARDTTIAAGATLIAAPGVTNPDGFALTWSATGLPAGASVDPATGVLTWATSLQQAGLVAGIVLTATDTRLASGSDSMTVSVANGLTLATLADTTVDELHQVIAQPQVLGAHGALTWDGIGLPAGASVNATTGLFTWTPDRFAGNPGQDTHIITLRATQSVSVYGQTSFLVTVHDLNTPPVITAAPRDTSVCAGSTAFVSFTATDAEGKVVGVGTDGFPEWVGIGFSKTKPQLSLEPGYADAATYQGYVIVFDDEGLSDTTTWSFTVLDDPLAPTFVPIPDQTVTEGDTLVVVPAVNNPRPADKLGWGMTFSGNYPAGATQDATTGALTFTVPPTCGADTRTTYEVHFYVKNEHCGSGLDTFLVHVVRKPIAICTTTAQFCTTRYLSVQLLAAGAEATGQLVWDSPELPSWASLSAGGVLSGVAPTGTSGRDTFSVVATNLLTSNTASAPFIATFSECTAASGLAAHVVPPLSLAGSAPPLYELRVEVYGDVHRDGVTPAHVRLQWGDHEIAARAVTWEGASATIAFQREGLARLLAVAPRAGTLPATLVLADDRGAELRAAVMITRLDDEAAAAYPLPSRGDVWLRVPAQAGADDALAVYNTTGARVRLLAQSGVGPSLVRWDGRLDDGSRAAAGVYYARCGTTAVARIVIAR